MKSSSCILQYHVILLFTFFKICVLLFMCMIVLPTQMYVHYVSTAQEGQKGEPDILELQLLVWWAMAWVLGSGFSGRAVWGHLSCPHYIFYNSHFERGSLYIGLVGLELAVRPGWPLPSKCWDERYGHHRPAFFILFRLQSIYLFLVFVCLCYGVPVEIRAQFGRVKFPSSTLWVLETELGSLGLA